MPGGVLAVPAVVTARGVALAAVLGGVLWAAGFLAPGSGLFAPFTWAALLAGSVLLIVAAWAVHRRQAGGVGDGLACAVVAAALALGAIPLAWFGPAGMWVAAYAYFFLLPVGAVPFAVATLRADVLPGVGAAFVAVGALGLPLVITWDEPRIWGSASAALFGLGWAWLGYGLWPGPATTSRA